MIIKVMNRRDMEKYCQEEHSEKSAIISISDSYDMYPKLKRNSNALHNNVLDILFLSFDDIQVTSKTTWWKKDEGLILDRLVSDGKVFQETIYSVFSEKEAQDIVVFFEKMADKIDILFVHCNAGISRSSGVAAAISCYYFGDDSEFFSERYHPNMTVYYTLLNTLVEKGKFGATNIISRKEKIKDD